MPRADIILIKVNTLVGTSFTIIAEPDDTVYELKERIELQEGVDSNLQHLLYGYSSKELMDWETLEDAGLCHGSTVTLALSMTAGPLKTKSIRMGFEHFQEGLGRELNEAANQNFQLLLVRVGGSVFLCPSAIFDDDEENQDQEHQDNNTITRPDTPPATREAVPENAITRSKVDNLRIKMDKQKKMKGKMNERTTSSPQVSARPITVRPKTTRRTPRNPFRRSASYEDNTNRVNLIKAEIALQSTRDPTQGKLPYTFSQLKDYTRAKIAILLEEERTAAGRNFDYITRPRPLIPTVLTRPIPTPTPSSSEFSSLSYSDEELFEHLYKEARIIPLKASTGYTDILNRNTAAFPQKVINTAANVIPKRRFKSPVPKKQRASTSSTSSVKRCYQCKKKLSVVNEYQCRCGKFFCSKHRYAETHKCTFDYKAEGRRVIKEANPVVTAPKVPQI